MTFINADNAEETIVFSAPFNQIAPIVSNSGKQATNEMQALGSSITYMRRYLYMLALDICESDGIDASLGNGDSGETPAPAPKAPPATPAERDEVKKGLTNSEGTASALQIKQLKAALKKLREAHPEKEEMIAKVAVDTNGFTQISKADCEKLLTGISEMLADKEGEEA
jgi:hypothetical protein